MNLQVTFPSFNFTNGNLIHINTVLLERDCYVNLFHIFPPASNSEPLAKLSLIHR